MNQPTHEEMYQELEELRRQLSDLRKRMSGALAINDPSADELPRGEIPLLLCQLEQEMIGFPLSIVKEVAPIAALTPMPESPPWVHGMLNLRGHPVLVMDVSARLEQRVRSSKLTDLIVICNCDGQQIGLLVPDIIGVQTFAADVARGAVDGLARAPYLMGVLNFEGTQIFVLSVTRLLGLSDLPEAHEPEVSG